MKNKFISTLNYRPDIDGLRAIAILSVILFHTFPEILPGGYLGVDVFFVISGYLISLILLRNSLRGHLALRQFYIRRVKRIFPSLLILLLICFIIGKVALFPQEFKSLNKYIFSSTVFITNFFLLGDSGYFDSASAVKPLLNLWSLAIEEQFYIAWPLLLMIFLRYKINRMLAISVFGLISYYLCITYTNQNSSLAFYTPWTRFWELFVGAFVAEIYFKLHQSNATFSFSYNMSNLLSISGILFISLSFAWNSLPLFPLATLPVVGTALIILSGISIPNKSLLSNKTFVYLGLISYPLYLYHWPALSFLRIENGSDPANINKIYCLCVVFILSVFTYHYIEKPIRQSKNYITWKILILMMFTVSMTSIIFYSFSQSTSIRNALSYFMSSNSKSSEFRISDIPKSDYEKVLLSLEQSMVRSSRQSECYDIPYAYKIADNWFCTIGDPNASTLLFVYGDSHALSLIPALEKLANETSKKILFAGASGCPPLMGIQSMRGDSEIDKHNCLRFNERIFQFVKENSIPNVLLIARWLYYTGTNNNADDFNFVARNINSNINQQQSKEDMFWAISNTASLYRKVGVNVYIAQDNPHQLFQPKDILRKSNLTDKSINKYAISRELHISTQHQINRVLRDSGANVINFDNLLCDNKICPFSINSKFLYYDDDHLSDIGALTVYPALKSFFVQEFAE